MLRDLLKPWICDKACDNVLWIFRFFLNFIFPMETMGKNIEIVPCAIREQPKVGIAIFWKWLSYNDIIRLQADHQKKSQTATTKRQVLQNQYFVGLFLLSFGYLDRHEKVTDRQKLVSNSYPRQNSSKRGTICRKMAKCCRDLATLHLSHYELIKVVL